jgi:hypothetical protein
VAVASHTLAAAAAQGIVALLVVAQVEEALVVAIHQHRLQ